MILPISRNNDIIFLQRFDGSLLESIQPLQVCHGAGGMASTRGRPMIFGGVMRAPRTEILDMTTLEWTVGPMQTIYPSMGNYWGSFSIIQREEDIFYAVGGNLRYGGVVTTIAKYDAGVWTHVGDLLSARTMAGLVFNGNELLIIGGSSPDEFLSGPER